MKRIILLMMLASLFTLTGCDFFRTLAGRPTSEDINAIKIQRQLAQQAIEQARLDSLRHEQEIVKDSLSAVDSIKQYGGSILNPSRLGGLFATKLEYRYHVIIGAFCVRSNAEALLVKTQKLGYKPLLINFNNGLTAVGLCPTNNIVDAKNALKKVRSESFCPKDVWLLLNE